MQSPQRAVSEVLSSNLRRSGIAVLNQAMMPIARIVHTG